MGFVLDNLSVSRTKGVHPDLIRVVMSCAADSALPFTFGISCGLRTHQAQKLAVASGKSKTMNSRHLDGHAVDLVALVSGEAAWDWPLYFSLADAMRAASIRCRVPLVWGGCWGKEMATYTGSAEDASAEYVTGGGRFLDGPHYELPRDKYLAGAYTPGIRTA